MKTVTVPGYRREPAPIDARATIVFIGLQLEGECVLPVMGPRGGLDAGGQGRPWRGFVGHVPVGEGLHGDAFRVPQSLRRLICGSGVADDNHVLGSYCRGQNQIDRAGGHRHGLDAPCTAAHRHREGSRRRRRVPVQGLIEGEGQRRRVYGCAGKLRRDGLQRRCAAICRRDTLGARLERTAQFQTLDSHPETTST